MLRTSCRRRSRKSALNSYPILLAQVGRAAPQCLDTEPAPVNLVEQAIHFGGQRLVLPPLPKRLALPSPLHPLLLLVAHVISHRAKALWPCAVRVSSKAYSPTFPGDKFCELRLNGILRSSASGWGTSKCEEGYVVLLYPALPYEGVEFL